MHSFWSRINAIFTFSTTMIAIAIIFSTVTHFYLKEEGIADVKIRKLHLMYAHFI